MDIWGWLAVIVVSIVIEIITMELVSGWFAVGALFALILSAFNVGLTVELIVFITVSLGLLLTIRKWALKLLKNAKNADTNLDLVIHKKTKLLTDITKDKFGTVSINGVVWNVATNDSSTIAAGEYVTILSVNGNKLIVEKGE